MAGAARKVRIGRRCVFYIEVSELTTDPASWIGPSRWPVSPHLGLQRRACRTTPCRRAPSPGLHPPVEEIFMDENNVVPLPLPTVAKCERRPPRPREYPSDCYSWIAATTTRKGHWRLNRYAVLRHQGRPARDRGSGGRAGGPGHPPPDPPVAGDCPDCASTDRSLDDACRVVALGGMLTIWLA